jgi:carboxyl-terminal processing protease
MQSDWLPASSSPDSAKRRRSRLPMIVSVLAAALIAFGGGMVVDHLTVSAQQTQAQAPLKDFAIYEQALQDIRDHYVGRNTLTDQQLLYGSISGLVDSLGDTNHTRFLTAQEYQQMTSQLSGSVAGIGILVSETNGSLTVARVIGGSPAESAGVKAGDTITAVDGVSTAGMTFDQLAAKIRGTIGTKVTISVIHAGTTTPVNLTMIRAQVATPLVDWNIVPGTHVADIALFEFSSGATSQVQLAIAAAKKQGATSIVFDLRGNPGGLADQARTVASEFLSSGVVYIEEDGSGNQTKITVDTSQVSTALPMVVVVDHDTASAAEIVAGALQDSHRAKVVGVTTVGTGTVLEPFVLSDGSVVLLGIADWLTPAGHRIFAKGITPDQTVAMPTGGQVIDPIDLSAMTSAQFQASTDAQLLAAVKAISQ